MVTEYNRDNSHSLIIMMSPYLVGSQLDLNIFPENRNLDVLHFNIHSLSAYKHISLCSEKLPNVLRFSA